MKHMNTIRDFLYRIRLAWAVFRGDYGWVEKHATDWVENRALGFVRCIISHYMNRKHPDSGDRYARKEAMRKVIDYGLPFIAIWKDYDSCYISYSGTEKELDELKNQEIIID